MEPEIKSQSVIIRDRACGSDTRAHHLHHHGDDRGSSDAHRLRHRGDDRDSSGDALKGSGRQHERDHA